MRLKYWKRNPYAKHLECNICHKIYKYEVIPQTGNWHFVTIHPDIYFSHLKSSHLSSKQFLGCCKHAINVETVKGKRLHNEVRKCAHCNMKFKKAPDLRRHIVIVHHALLEENPLPNFKNPRILTKLLKLSFQE